MTPMLKLEGREPEDGTEFVARVNDALLAERNDLGVPNLSIVSIPEFQRIIAGNKLSSDDKLIIIAQALTMMEQFYPHLPFKNKQHGDAVGWLTRLANQELSDADFHSMMIIGFGLNYDPHTLYGLPAPYAGSVAFLPFQVRYFRDEHELPRLIVTKVMKQDVKGEVQHPFFRPGVEITAWNGSVAQFYIENSRARTPGGTQAAKEARGTAIATVRSLTYCDLPEQEEDTILYLPPGGSQSDLRGMRIKWQVAMGMGAKSGFPSLAFSQNVPIDLTLNAHRVFMRASSLQAPASSDLERVSKLPKQFEFRSDLRDDGNPDLRFGLVRIRSFSQDGILDDTDATCDEFHRILELMSRQAPDGLIIDLRANSGGDTKAAEQMLQMLTTKPLVPMRYCLADTPGMRFALERIRALLAMDREKLTREQRHWLADAKVELRPWIEAGDPKAALPLHSLETHATEDIPYRGPLVLLIDALSYSASDIFAAGFQDNQIGPVAGMAWNSGGGGGNVWRHEDLLSTFRGVPELGLTELPGGVTMSLAIRRCIRAGGLPIEDIGVVPDVFYNVGSPEQIFEPDFALRPICKMLAAKKPFALTLLSAERDGDALVVELESTNVDSVDLNIQFRDTRFEIKPGGVQKLIAPWPAGEDRPVLRVAGYAHLPAENGLERVLVTRTPFVSVPFLR